MQEVSPTSPDQNRYGGGNLLSAQGMSRRTKVDIQEVMVIIVTGSDDKQEVGVTGHDNDDVFGTYIIVPHCFMTYWMDWMGLMNNIYVC
jgi:hypothetical protein